MSRRKKKRAHGEVELNLAAMLDMAFQLLTFFILTFKPAPIEGQVALRLPPPQAVQGKPDPNAKQAGSDENDTSQIIGVSTLVISAFATPDGKLHSTAVGETTIPNIPQLSNKLEAVFSDPANPFDQVIVQVSPDLRYDELMRVVEVCTKQKLQDGSKLAKLSFVDLQSTGQ